MSGTGNRRRGASSDGGGGRGAGATARRKATIIGNAAASPSTSASPLEDEQLGGGGSRKRLRVSRACDSCYNKKDKCDGALPVCKVCRELDRRCTYDRPERKRGPLQGVRQRLEGQIEILESVLGFLVHSFPALQADMIRRLHLDDGEAFMRSQQAGSPQHAGPSRLPIGEIFPHFSKQQARFFWRSSDFARGVAPSLGLSLGGGGGGGAFGSGVDDDDLAAIGDASHHRLRVEEARRARMHLLGPQLQQQKHFPDPSPPSGTTDDAATITAAAAAAAFIQGHNEGQAHVSHYPIPVHASSHDHSSVSGAHHHQTHALAALPFMHPPPPPLQQAPAAHFVAPSLPHAPPSLHSAGLQTHFGKHSTAHEHNMPASTPPDHAAWSHQPFDLADLGADAHALAYALGLPAADVGPGHGTTSASGAGISSGPSSHQHHRHVPAAFLLNTASSPGGFYPGPSFSSPSPVTNERTSGRTPTGPLPYIGKASMHRGDGGGGGEENAFDTPIPFEDDLDALANLAGVHVPHDQASSILMQLGLQDHMTEDDVAASLSSEVTINARQSPHDPTHPRSHWPTRMPVQ